VEQEIHKQFEKSTRRELRSPPPPSLFPKTIVALKDAPATPADDSPSEEAPTGADSAAETTPESPATPSDGGDVNQQDDVIEEIEPVRQAAVVAPRGKVLIHSASFFLSPEKLRRGTYQPRKHSFFDENQVISFLFPDCLFCLLWAVY
jgi:hypothetical protein